MAGSGLGPICTRPAQTQRNESFGLSQCAKWQMRAVGHSAMMLLRGAPGLIAAPPTNRPERFFYSPLTPAPPRRTIAAQDGRIGGAQLAAVQYRGVVARP